MRFRRPAALLLASILGVAGALAVGAPAHAAVFTVTSTLDDGSAGTLRWAIEQSETSSGPDEIRFDPGLDGGTITLAASLPTITQALTIAADGLELAVERIAGFEMIQVAPGTADAHFTLRGLQFSGAGSSARALSVDGGYPVDVVIDGSTFTDFVEGPAGGAVAVWDVASLEIADSAFTGNRSGDVGGAVRAMDIPGAVEIVSSRFEANSSQNDGGAVSVSRVGSLHIQATRFERNESSESVGGGLELSDIADVEIADSFLLDNVAEGTISGSSFGLNGALFGGAVRAVTSTPLAIRTSEFFSNAASAGDGGAIHFEALVDSGLDIVASQFRDNAATGSGSAIRLLEIIVPVPTPVSIASTTVTAGDQGAASLIDLGRIHAGASVDIVNSTLDAGAESAAPAIETGRVSGSLTVRHSTIAADTGILVDSADSAGIAVTHTAFAAGGDAIVFGTPVTDPSYRAAVSWSATDVPVDPDAVEDVEGNRFDLASLGLGQLFENGGPAYLSGVALLTRVPDASSPLVDAGQQPTPAAAPASDERGAGFDRVSDGRIDIGAIEVQPADPTLPATGGTVPWWLVIAGAIVLVAGAALLIITRLRRRS